MLLIALSIYFNATILHLLSILSKDKDSNMHSHNRSTFSTTAATATIAARTQSDTEIP
jgi:hypothetical protein